MDIKSNLKALTEKAGVSGDEREASEAAAELLRQYADNVEIDSFGNITGTVKSDAPDAQTLMLDAHIDRIGMIVTYIDEGGFVKMGSIGGTDNRIMAAQSVTVHGKRKIRGVISTLPPHVSNDHSKVAEIGELAVDVGMTKEEAEKCISLGDRITINSDFRELIGDRVSAPAVDDRSGVCAILTALKMLKSRKLKYNIAVSFSAQEETGERGVKQTAFRIRPDRAIAVDVSFGRTPDSEPQDTAELGSGVMIGFSAALDREMSESLRNIAAEKDIPFTVEVMPSSTGTNADSIAVSGGGVRCCTLSFPIRYMHTPTETVDIRDIEATARLICEYAGGEENV